MTYDYALLRERLRTSFPPIIAAHVPEGHRYQRTDTGVYAWSVTTKLGFVAKGYLPRWYAKRSVEHIRENLSALLAGDLSVLDTAIGAGESSRDASADIGTTAHGAIEKYLTEWIETGCRPQTAAHFLKEGSRGEEIAACRSFDRLIAEREIIPLASEITVWYEQGKDLFAGTVDALFLLLTVHKGREGAGRWCEAKLDAAFEKGHDYVFQKGRVYWCPGCGREVDASLVLADWKSSNNIKQNDGYAQQDTAYGKAVEKASGLKIDDMWVVRLDKWSAEYEICRVNNKKEAWKEFITISRAFDEKQKRSSEHLLSPLLEKTVIHI